MLRSPSVLCRVALASSLIVGALATSPAVAQVQSAAQQKCLGTLTKGAAKVLKARFKDYQGCLKSASLSQPNGCPDVEACIAADLTGKVASTLAKFEETAKKSCFFAPDFGRRPTPLLERSIAVESLGLLDDLLGPDLDAAVLTKATNPSGLACQTKVLKSAIKLMSAMSATYDACKTSGLADGSIVGPSGLAACTNTVDLDAKGKVAAARRSLDATLAGTCKAVALPLALPGSCAVAPSVGDCIETSARCRACRRSAIGDDAGADCDQFDDALPNGSCVGFAGRCNGHAGFCPRTFENVAYPTTHNAMTNAEENWPQPNQRYGLTRQLSDGVRAMMLDTYDFSGEIMMCHYSCTLGEAGGFHPRELLTSGLGKIREYLEVDGGAVLSIIFESYITEAQAAQAFADAGLAGLVHQQPIGDPWPTLEALVSSGKRLVVFTDDSSASLPWHHYVWDYAWETPYSFYDVDEFTCNINRGTMSNDLFILNHFPDEIIRKLRARGQGQQGPALHRPRAAVPDRRRTDPELRDGGFLRRGAGVRGGRYAEWRGGVRGAVGERRCAGPAEDPGNARLRWMRASRTSEDPAACQQRREFLRGKNPDPVLGDPGPWLQADDDSLRDLGVILDQRTKPAQVIGRHFRGRFRFNGHGHVPDDEVHLAASSGPPVREILRTCRVTDVCA